MKSESDLQQLIRDIQDYIIGDFEKEVVVAQMLEIDYSLVNDLIDGRPTFLLSKGDVVKILNRYVIGELSLDRLSQWGKFVFWRHWIPSPNNKFLPLTIDYVPRKCELICELILKIEQIGDELDGEFSKDDAISYIHKLKI
jgi:hypothetical protein